MYNAACIVVFEMRSQCIPGWPCYIAENNTELLFILLLLRMYWDNMGLPPHLVMWCQKVIQGCLHARQVTLPAELCPQSSSVLILPTVVVFSSSVWGSRSGCDTQQASSVPVSYIPSLLVYLFFFFKTVSLYSPECSRTHYVVQAGFKLRSPALPLGFQV